MIVLFEVVVGMATHLFCIHYVSVMVIQTVLLSDKVVQSTLKINKQNAK